MKINQEISLIKLNLILVYLINIYFLFKYGNHIDKNNENIKIALCTMGKDENLYVEEFIEYYVKLGVNHLFIYDDNENNTEKIFDIMNKQYQKYVTIFETNIFKINNQTSAFTECYNNHKKEFDWFIMVDMDEYLYINID